MITKARIQKIEQQIIFIDKKKYKYAFDNYEEFEEAKKQGLVDPNPPAGQPAAIILDA